MKFFVGIFSTFLFITILLVILLPSINNKNNVHAALNTTCNFTATYGNGQQVTNNQIVVGQSFTIQASMSEPQIAGYHVVFMLAGGGGFEDVTPPNGMVPSISITSQQIFFGHPGVTPANGDILVVELFVGSSAPACGSMFTDSSAEYTFVQTASTCTGNINVSGNSATAIAQDCDGKAARIDVIGPNANRQNLLQTNISGNNWTSSPIDISSYLQNWEYLILYICDSSNPNCSNEVARNALVQTAGCPTFASYNPSQPQSGQDIQIQYFPFAGKSPSDFVVLTVVDNVGTQHNLTSAYARWVTGSIGTYSGGTTIGVQLFPAGSDINDVRNRCDNRTFVIPSHLGSGKNPCTADGCETALGTIPTSIAGFASTFLSIAIGLAGGIALILMVLGSVQVLTSSGNQQNLNAGRDRLVAAVAGLLFLIFSALILRFIGLNILGGIPGIG